MAVVVVVKAITVRRLPHTTRNSMAAGHPPEPEFHIIADECRWHIRLQAHHQGVMGQPTTHVSLDDLATRERTPAKIQYNNQYKSRDKLKLVREQSVLGSLH